VFELITITSVSQRMLRGYSQYKSNDSPGFSILSRWNMLYSCRWPAHQSAPHARSSLLESTDRNCRGCSVVTARYHMNEYTDWADSGAAMLPLLAEGGSIRHGLALGDRVFGLSRRQVFPHGAFQGQYVPIWNSIDSTSMSVVVLSKRQVLARQSSSPFVSASLNWKVQPQLSSRCRRSVSVLVPHQV
jgi:hypothetical protein